MEWAAIIGAIGAIIGGIATYASNSGNQNEARDLSQQKRSDDLEQQKTENKRAQDAADLNKSRFGYGVMQNSEQAKLAQQQTNRGELEKTANYFSQKAKESPMFKQQLLSLWK